MELRRATPADAERLGRAIVDGLEDYPSFAPTEWSAPPVSQEIEELQELLADDRVWCTVAEHDGRLAGQVTVLPAAIGPRPVADPQLAHFRNLFVEREFWGTGVASALHAAAVEAARGRGFSQMRLFVASGQHRARRFYEREGWVAATQPFFDPAPGLEIVEYRYAL